MEKKTLRQKLSFAAADIFGGGSFNIINFLYPGFLALTVGLNALLAGIIMLVVRVWDAITDPLMGYISDKTNSKWGKRRIYLILASPFILVSMFLLFFPFNFNSLTLRFIAVLLSYMLFTTVQTSVMIPYYSLSSEISSDYKERASFNSVRLGFSIFSSILCVAVPGLIVNAFANERTGYQVMSLIFGLLFAISVLITGLFSKEEIKTEPNKDKFSIKKLIEPLKLKIFRQYLLMHLMTQISMVVMAGLFFFYIDFHIIKDTTAAMETSSVGLIAAALMFFMQIVALPFYLALINKKSKMFAYQVGALIWILSALLIFIIPANSKPIYVYLFAAIIGFGISGPGLVPHTMYGDIVDVSELKHSKRLDGQMSGFANFMTKSAQGIGMYLSLFVLWLTGFKEQVLGEPQITSQPASAILAIKLIMIITPLILMTVGIIISFKYKLDANMQTKVKEALNTGENKEELLDALTWKNQTFFTI